MGPGILRRLTEARIAVDSIDIILLTHFHPDHVSDLPPFLFATNYEHGPVRQAPFHVLGPEGSKTFYDKLVRVFGKWIVPKGDRLRMQQLDARAPDEVHFEGLGVTVRSAPAEHTFPSLSYRIEAEGVSVTISGDTDTSERLMELAADSDILICECSFPDEMKVKGHLIPSEAGEIAQKARAKKLMLTHFYPPCDETDIVSQAAAKFSGEVIKAEDLMILEC
ncbi:MAG: MBL fold metallo-hydrolase, partial [Desulfomonile tiedjei]|nr:MBL fold metallo-hydrolase [Desulfomonile tiedjei]